MSKKLAQKKLETLNHELIDKLLASGVYIISEPGTGIVLVDAETGERRRWGASD